MTEHEDAHREADSIDQLDIERPRLVVTIAVPQSRAELSLSYSGIGRGWSEPAGAVQ